jgi:TolA-binding protein
VGGVWNLARPMSSPTANPPTSTPDPGFDPVAFWYLHKKQITALVAIFAIGLSGYAIQQWMENSARLSAQTAFANAKTADDFKKVIAEHAGTMAAANAQLRLAELQRKDGKLEEAMATLKAFIEKNPQHPLIAGAWLGIAENQEAAGKADEALTSYQKVATTYPTSYAAALALLAQARLQKDKGQIDLAKRTYDQIVSQFPGSDFVQQALQQSAALKKTAP